MHIVLRFFVFVVALLIIFWYSICRRLAHFRERVTIENRAQLRDSVQQAIYLFEYNDFHFILFFLMCFLSLLFLGTPINRLPIMAKSVLDLYELYNLVIARGGLVDVINKKLWQEIIKGLHLPSSITSAAFTLRTQ